MSRAVQPIRLQEAGEHLHRLLQPVQGVRGVHLLYVRMLCLSFLPDMCEESHDGGGYGEGTSQDGGEVENMNVEIKKKIAHHYRAMAL